MNLLRRLLSSDTPHPLDAVPSPLPSAVEGGEIAGVVRPKVLAIIHNPLMPNNQKIQQVYRWNDPDKLAQGYIDDIAHCSHGYARYQIVDRIEVDAFPLKLDGFRYTPGTFAQAWQTSRFHNPDAVDYLALVREFSIIERVDSGEIDEVWLLGFPYCGYYESIMAGPGAFWCNAPPLKGTEHASRRFVIMGFNYERGIGEMLEDLGHRAESIISKVYEHTHGDANLWERFTRYDKTHPGRAECGNVHFAPNSERDYDWGNRRRVLSRCDNWLSFPDLSGAPRMVNCTDWGDGDIRKHHIWWMRRFPHIPGSASGVASNWWHYIIDPNHVRA